jgi:hypothetical protein
MLDSLDVQRILFNGTLFSLTLGVIIIGSLIYNPRLWLQDYPKPIRDKVPPLSSSEKRDRAIVGILFLGTMVGGLILISLQLRTSYGSALPFGTAYLHSFLIMSMFNLFDALVIDLPIAVLKPRFVIIPGAEGMEYLLQDYRQHFVNFLKGVLFCAIFSLPFAVLAVL